METYTVKDLKERYIAHLMSLDMGKMDMQELGQYGYIIKNLDEMEKPGYAEALNMALGAYGCCKGTKEE